jgi:hypothetical protein
VEQPRAQTDKKTMSELQTPRRDNVPAFAIMLKRWKCATSREATPMLRPVGDVVADLFSSDSVILAYPCLDIAFHK